MNTDTIDPGEYTIDQVRTYCVNRPGEVALVLGRELAGKNRKGLVEAMITDLHLQSLDGIDAAKKLMDLKMVAETRPHVTIQTAMYGIERGSFVAETLTLVERAEWVLEQDDIVALMVDRKINAIKEVRARTNLGLKEAKEAVEQAVELQKRGHMTRAERRQVELESAAAIASIEQTMMALSEGAESAGVRLS